MKVEIAGVVLAVVFFSSLMLIGRRNRANHHDAHSMASQLDSKEQKESLSAEPVCLCEPCRTIEILYQNSKGQMTIRDIDVLRVYQENQQWYVEAFCHLLTEQRIFQVEKIKCLKCPKHCSRLINSAEILEYLTKHISL